MARYTKETPRITVKFIDKTTEEELFDLTDRSWLNVGEIFPSATISNIITNELKDRKPPRTLMVIAVAEYNLEKD